MSLQPDGSQYDGASRISTSSAFIEGSIGGSIGGGGGGVRGESGFSINSDNQDNKYTLYGATVYDHDQGVGVGEDLTAPLNGNKHHSRSRSGSGLGLGGGGVRTHSDGRNNTDISNNYNPGVRYSIESGSTIGSAVSGVSTPRESITVDITDDDEESIGRSSYNNSMNAAAATGYTNYLPPATATVVKDEERGPGEGLGVSSYSSSNSNNPIKNLARTPS